MPEEQRAKDGAAVAATAQRSDLPRSVTDRSKKCLAERFQGFLNSNLIIKNSKNLNWKKSKKYKLYAFLKRSGNCLFARGICLDWEPLAYPIVGVGGSESPADRRANRA